MKVCNTCDFNDEGGCNCPRYDKWYSCPIENKKPENIQAIKEYVEWLSQYDYLNILDNPDILDKLKKE